MYMSSRVQKNKADSIINWLINTMNDEAKKERVTDEMRALCGWRTCPCLFRKRLIMIRRCNMHWPNYNRRPSNIEVNETLAWAYYNKKEYDKALAHIWKQP